MADNLPFSRTDALIAEHEVAAPVRITDTDRLSYHIPAHKLRELQARPQASTYWSYEWYRNSEGKKVTVSYASTREQSEELAKRFLKERVLGFDMEWKPDFTRRNGNGAKKRRNPRTLKDEISLIQVASTEEIALFHIALHKGTRPVELVARSLREIIESNAIIKTGVGIYSADASRLRKFMKFQPRGMLDLNHLHRLVDISSRKKMISLSEHARIHLGFPLFKGKVRTSDWTKSLSVEQQNYAASDAYVGLVLYHVLDVRRLNLDPIPSHPELDRNPNPKDPAPDSGAQPARPGCEAGLPEPRANARVKTRGSPVGAAKTLAIPPTLSPCRPAAPEVMQHRTALATPAATLPLPSPPKNEERRLLANLHSLRFRLQKSTGLPLEAIAGVETLNRIAKQRPDNVPAFCRIPGAGKLYQLCKARKINLLDCIKTPPTSISFDSSLSLVDTKSTESLQLQRNAESHSREEPAYSKIRRCSCSPATGQELFSPFSHDSIVVGAEQRGTIQDPISILSSPLFSEPLDSVVLVREGAQK